MSQAAVDGQPVPTLEAIQQRAGVTCVSAGLLGPLRAELEGKRVGVLLCGTNTDPPTLARHRDAAPALA